MLIRLYGTTKRAVRIFEELVRVAPGSRFHVVTEPPSPPEPDYLAALSAATNAYAEMSIIDAPPYEFDERADLTLCVNWRRKLKVETSERPNTFVIHDSLLPKYRGHSPLLHAIRNGDEVAGATMFVPTDEIDAGDVVGQETIALDSLYITQAFDSMTEAYVRLVQRFVPLILEGSPIETHPQEGVVVRAPRVDWEKEPQIDTAWTEEKIRNHIRAFSPPYPRAFVMVDGKKVYAGSAAELSGRR